MYDVVVVGARCAGASLAMLLARRGHRVALVDRATFPSDTISSHFLWQHGAARLESWGLLGELRSLGCRPLPVLTFDFGPVAITGRPPAVRGVSETFCPRRTVLDNLLVDAAVRAGAELVDRTSVQSVRWSDGRACGVEVRALSGAATRLDARLVVGADGRNSRVAREVRAEAYGWSPPLTFVYYSYWSGMATISPAYHMRPGRLILRWPTNDGLTCLYVGSPHSEFVEFRRDIEGNFLRSLEAVPGLREETTAGRREERFRGAADLPNFYRTSFGDGWALAGDAGHHKDPTTGLGMSDALASAELLAGAVDEALVGRRSWNAALGDYQRGRDEATANGLRLTLSAAALDPLPPRLQHYYEAASENPEAVTRILGALGGAIPLDDVFSAARIEAVVGGSNGRAGGGPCVRGLSPTRLSAWTRSTSTRRRRPSPGSSNG
ncbi:MAG TPA: NAD(P)/FAD-dependent oxidoreductase [Candidatus Dormibacteraeota bacterium]